MATTKRTRKTTGTRKAAPKRAAKAAGARVKDSANKVWLAGLGAFAMAEEEGGKLFKGLVAKGKEFEEVGREKLEEAREKVGSFAETAKERVEAATDDVRDRASALFGKVEDRWDDRMASALQRFGVPSREEIARLTKRIEELTRLVENRPAAKRGRPARKSGSRRSTQKKAG
jgi:poly(hydroxyalkanoate) granule-associated protein